MGVKAYSWKCVVIHDNRLARPYIYNINNKNPIYKSKHYTAVNIIMNNICDADIIMFIIRQHHIISNCISRHHIISIIIYHALIKKVSKKTHDIKIKKKK